MQIEKNSDKLVRTLRVRILDQPGYLGRLATAIGAEGGNIGDITFVQIGLNYNTRDVTVYMDDEPHSERILQAVGKLEGINIIDVIDPVLQRHQGGKIAVKSTVALETISDARKVYTPGVANVCRLIGDNLEKAYDYTAINNTVAIVTNGTAILGLGDIGPVAGMPVMEGKAVLFDKLAGISGVPILLKTKDVDEFVQTVIQISPGFGAIQLEDVAAPACFEIERRLSQALDIPVMHDDQHGTAVVVLAALTNACKYSGVSMKNEIVGVIGLGAAGMGISHLLQSHGIKKLMGSDLRSEAMEMQKAMGGEPASLNVIMEKSNVVIATTGCPNLIKPEMVRPGQIILALSNPNAEIKPEEALAAGAVFAADGRSVNNALGFPGLFRGALNARATTINHRMKLAAARAIAEHAPEGEIVPNFLDLEVHQAVAQAVERAAMESGVIKPRTAL